MAHRRNLFIFGLVIVGVALLAGIIRQRGLTPPVSAPQNIIITQDYDLAATIDDSLVVIADTIRLDEASRIRGDAALIGRGQVRLDGQIDGNLTVMSGTLEIGAASRVAGSVAFMGGQMTVAGNIGGDVKVMGQSLVLAPSAPVSGHVIACVGTLDTANIAADRLRPCSENDLLASFAPLQAVRGSVSGAGLPAASLLGTLPLALALVGLSTLAVAAFPGRFNRIETSLRAAPREVARTGVLALLLASGAASALVVALAIAPPLGLVLLPPGLLLALALLVMALVGWITLALYLGSRLLPSHDSTLPPLVAVLSGSLALCLLTYALALLPFGVLLLLAAGAVLAALGLGVTLATRFGTMPTRRFAASG